MHSYYAHRARKAWFHPGVIPLHTAMGKHQQLRSISLKGKTGPVRLLFLPATDLD